MYPFIKSVYRYLKAECINLLANRKPQDGPPAGQFCDKHNYGVQLTRVLAYSIPNFPNTQIVHRFASFAGLEIPNKCLK